MLNIILSSSFLVFLLLSIFILYFKYQYLYWKHRNVPYLPPKIPWGNFQNLLNGKECMSNLAHNFYQRIKENNQKHGGLFFFNTPIYMPIDPEYIKNILASDFDYFNERGVYFDKEKDPLSSHLFNLPYKPWKLLRTKMSPLFTSGKLRVMFPIMAKCSEGLITAVEEQKVLDINDVSVRYTIDIIGSCAFGLECNSLKNSNNTFQNIANKVTNPPKWNAISFFISLLSPKTADLFKVNIRTKDVVDFFTGIVRETIEYREENGVNRNDFMQLMINMRKNEDCKDLVMDFEMVTAQAYVFFAAGYETSSMTINLCLFELSQNKDIQDRVREEIQENIKRNNGLTYDGIMEMVYLDKIVQETMRKYPSLGYLNRMCTKRYRIPGTDVVLDKGTMVLISSLGLHRDPDHYENPELFDPERFSNENKSNIKHFTYIPFGEGHRICIGARFGMMQTKICLSVLLGNFKFSLNDRTKIPIEYNSTSFVNSLKNLIYLNAVRIDV